MNMIHRCKPVPTEMDHGSNVQKTLAADKLVAEISLTLRGGGSTPRSGQIPKELQSKNEEK